MLARRSGGRTEDSPSSSIIRSLVEQMDRFSETMESWTGYQAVAPRIDLSEDEDSFYVRAELPGVVAEDIDLSIQNGNLVISGESSAEREDERYHYRERVFGRFYRTIALPSGLDLDEITADLENGVLTVRFLKSEGRRTIQVKTEARAIPETREGYTNRIESDIKGWSSKLEELKAKAGEKSEELRKKYQEEMEALGEKIEEVKHRLSQLAASTGETWEGLKARVEEAIADLKAKFKKVEH